MTKGTETSLEISRLIKAPRTAVWAAWSDPRQLEQWWCPKPWTAKVAGFDLSPGGIFHTIMHSPDGKTFDEGPGSFLFVTPMEKIVLTSVLREGWWPVANPSLPFTAIITMADEGTGTRYIARALHPDSETKDRHEKMGFFDGWGTVIEQLEAHAVALANDGSKIGQDA